MLCMLLGVGNAWATDPDEEVDFSAQGYTNQQAITSYSGTDFTVSFNKGTNNNAPKYYGSGAAIRAYGGNYFTVSSTTKTIEKIVITFGSGDGSNAITTDEDSYEDGTWEGSASSVTFTIGGTSGNRRIRALAIYYASSGGENPSITASNVNIDYNVTSGSIAYSLANATGNVSASVTSGDWLTLGTITASEVPFTCSANTESTARTATVTLSYTGASDKVVTITQTAAPLANLAALVAAGAGSNYVTLTNALVTYKNGNNAYIQDASAGMYLYGCAGDLAAGDQISGVMNVTTTVYKNLPEVTAFTLVDGYTKTSGNTVTAEEVTLEELIADYDSYLSRYVVIKGATVQSAFSSKNSTIEQNGNTIVMRDQNSTATLTSTVDDVVDVYCHPAIFNDTKQLSVWEQSQIVVNTVQLLDNVITVTGGTEFSMDPDNNNELTLVATATSGEAVTFTLDTETTLTVDEDFIFDADNGYLLVYNEYAGTIVIKANSAATETYKAAPEVTITINVSGQKAEPVFNLPSPALELTYGESYTFVNGTDYTTDGTLVLGVDNTDVIQIDGNTVTAVAVGPAHLSVSTTEGETYKASGDALNLSVIVNPTPGKTTAPSAATTLFEETFDKSDGTGGRDGTFTGSVGTRSLSEKTDENWPGIENVGANKCIKLGTGSNYKSVTTSTIALTGNGTLTFEAAGWGTGTNMLNVTAEGGTLSGDTEVTLTNGEFTSYTVNIADATGELVLTFSMKRGFLDEIVVASAGGSSATESVTLNAYGYGTYASVNPLDFSGENDFTAWEVTNIDKGVVTFNQVTSTIKGGQGVLLKGEAGAVVEIPMADGDTELTDNLFVGIVNPTYVSHHAYFGLKGTSLTVLNDGVVPAGKAIIETGNVDLPEGVKNFTFVFNSTDGIQTIEKVSAEEAAKIFDLSGRRLTEMRRGVNIVNGKKIMVK